MPNRAGTKRQAIVLFARGDRREAAAKRLPLALATLLRQRALAAARAVPGADVLEAVERCGAPGGAPGPASLEQRGATLGARLAHAFADAFARGYERVVVAAADVPELDAATLARALAAAVPGRTVLGPSPDGGVYLIALAAPVALDWSGIPWCTAAAGEALAAALRAAGLTIVELAPLADVDDRRGLVRMAREAGDRHLAAALLAALRPPRHCVPGFVVSSPLPAPAPAGRAPPSPALLPA